MGLRRPEPVAAPLNRARGQRFACVKIRSQQAQAMRGRTIRFNHEAARNIFQLFALHLRQGILELCRRQEAHGSRPLLFSVLVVVAADDALAMGGVLWLPLLRSCRIIRIEGCGRRGFRQNRRNLFLLQCQFKLVEAFRHAVSRTGGAATPQADASASRSAQSRLRSFQGFEPIISTSLDASSTADQRLFREIFWDA